jgi:cell wall assembly regulator SMI1
VEPERIVEVETQLGVALPPPLRSLYEHGDGRFRPDGQWWVVWPLNRLLVDNLDAWRRGWLPRSLLAFGDDGTGNPFCVDIDEGESDVLRWNWIDEAVERSEGPMADFIAEWIGDSA